MAHNPFNSLQDFTIGAKKGKFYTLPALEKAGVGKISRLPVSIRIVLESVLRNCDGIKVTEEHVRQLANWKPNADRTDEIPFVVARVVLQDFTGVPLLADLAAMRNVAEAMGKNPKTIEPLVPVDLVVDHSVMIDHYGGKDSLDLNMKLEFQRNRERYEFMKWGMQAFDTFGVVPPGFGIVHQVNLEYLARGVHKKDGVVYPDTLVGTDSHTTMINGIGVVGWGVGGIEAEAGMLGQPVYFLTPDVVGVNLKGKLREGVTATDLVLTITEMLRKAKVVGKFVEFFGEGTVSPRACPTAPRSRTWRRSTARRWASSRSTRRRSPTSRAPAARRTRSPPSRPTSARRACSACRRPARSTTRRSSSSTFRRSRRHSPDRSGRRTASRSATSRSSSRRSFRSPSAEMASTSRPPGSSSVSRSSDGHGRTEGKAPDAPAGAARDLAEMSANRPLVKPAPRAGRPRGRDRRRRCADRRDHLVHQHLEPQRAAGGRPAGQEGGRARPDGAEAHQDLARARLAHRDRLPDEDGPAALPRASSASTSRRTAARPASATPATWRPRSTKSSRRMIWCARQCCRATATSRRASIPNLKANFLASPPLVVAYAIAGTVLKDLMTEPLGKGKDGKDVWIGDVWPTSEEVHALMKDRRWTRSPSKPTTARSSRIRATCGRRSAVSPVRSTRGRRRPTSRSRHFSTASR